MLPYSSLQFVLGRAIYNMLVFLLLVSSLLRTGNYLSPLGAQICMSRYARIPDVPVGVSPLFCIAGALLGFLWFRPVALIAIAVFAWAFVAQFFCIVFL
jgi:hypothetical protein